MKKHVNVQDYLLVKSVNRFVASSDLSLWKETKERYDVSEGELVATNAPALSPFRLLQW